MGQSGHAFAVTFSLLSAENFPRVRTFAWFRRTTTFPKLTPVHLTFALTLELHTLRAHRPATLRTNQVKNVGNHISVCSEPCERNLHAISS